jgi:hypothetical protein
MNWNQYIPLAGLAMFLAGVYAFYLFVHLMVKRTERKEREQHAASTSEPASPSKSGR